MNKLYMVTILMISTVLGALAGRNALPTSAPAHPALTVFAESTANVEASSFKPLKNTDRFVTDDLRGSIASLHSLGPTKKLICVTASIPPRSVREDLKAGLTDAKPVIHAACRYRIASAGIEEPIDLVQIGNIWSAELVPPAIFPVGSEVDLIVDIWYEGQDPLAEAPETTLDMNLEF